MTRPPVRPVGRSTEAGNGLVSAHRARFGPRGPGRGSRRPAPISRCGSSTGGAVSTCGQTARVGDSEPTRPSHPFCSNRKEGLLVLITESFRNTGCSRNGPLTTVKMKIALEALHILVSLEKQPILLEVPRTWSLPLSDGDPRLAHEKPSVRSSHPRGPDLLTSHPPSDPPLVTQNA